MIQSGGFIITPYFQSKLKQKGDLFFDEALTYILDNSTYKIISFEDSQSGYIFTTTLPTNKDSPFAKLDILNPTCVDLKNTSCYKEVKTFLFKLILLAEETYSDKDGTRKREIEYKYSSTKQKTTNKENDFIKECELQYNMYNSIFHPESIIPAMITQKPIIYENPIEFLEKLKLKFATDEQTYIVKLINAIRTESKLATAKLGLCMMEFADGYKTLKSELTSSNITEKKDTCAAGLLIMAMDYNIIHNDPHEGNLMIKQSGGVYQFSDEEKRKTPNSDYNVNVIDFGRSINIDTLTEYDFKNFTGSKSSVLKTQFDIGYDIKLIKRETNSPILPTMYSYLKNAFINLLLTISIKNVRIKDFLDIKPFEDWIHINSDSRLDYILKCIWNYYKNKKIAYTKIATLIPGFNPDSDISVKDLNELIIKNISPATTANFKPAYPYTGVPVSNLLRLEGQNSSYATPVQIINDAVKKLMTGLQKSLSPTPRPTLTTPSRLPLTGVVKSPFEAPASTELKEDAVFSLDKERLQILKDMNDTFESGLMTYNEDHIYEELNNFLNHLRVEKYPVNKYRKEMLEIIFRLEKKIKNLLTPVPNKIDSLYKDIEKFARSLGLENIEYKAVPTPSLKPELTHSPSPSISASKSPSSSSSSVTISPTVSYTPSPSSTLNIQTAIDVMNQSLGIINELLNPLLTRDEFITVHQKLRILLEVIIDYNRNKVISGTDWNNYYTKFYKISKYLWIEQVDKQRKASETNATQKIMIEAINTDIVKLFEDIEKNQAGGFRYQRVRTQKAKANKKHSIVNTVKRYRYAL
jgi:hypothetical protein